MTSALQFLNDIKPYFGSRFIVYVDIGAFSGEIFTMLREQGIRCKEAHLIEANAVTYQNLRDQFKDDPLVSTYNFAVSSPDVKSVRFHADTYPTMSRVVDVSKSADLEIPSDNTDLLVESASYDSFSENLWDGGNDVALLKIDVEGHELQVLRGASESLQRQSVDVIYIEAGLDPSNSQQTYYRKIEDLLNSFGYKIFKIYEQHHEWMKDNPLLRRVNIAFFSTRFAEMHPPSLVNSLEDLRAEHRLQTEKLTLKNEELTLKNEDLRLQIEKLRLHNEELRRNSAVKLDELQHAIAEGDLARQQVELIQSHLLQVEEDLDESIIASCDKSYLLKESEMLNKRVLSLLLSLAQ